MASRFQPPKPQPVLSIPALPVATAYHPPRIVSILAIAYAGLILMGLLVFKSSAMPTGSEMSLQRAVFWSVNAVSQTGFQTAGPGPNDFKPMAQFVFFVLTLGGAFINLVIASIAVVRIVRSLPYSTNRIMTAAAIALVVPPILGVVLLRHGLETTTWHTVAGSAGEGLAAFVNCGAFVGRIHALSDWQTFMILMPLATLGGLGLPVLLELFDLAVKHRRLSSHASTVLTLTGGLFLIFFALFAVMQVRAATWLNTDPTQAGEASPELVKHADLPGIDEDAEPIKSRPSPESVLRANSEANWAHLQDILASSCVASINSRTAGLPFQEVLVFPRAMQWLMMLAMIIGASPAGTGSGLKNTTVLEIFRGTARTLRGEMPGRVFGVALTALGCYAGVAIFAVLLLLSLEAQMPPDRILFMTISALSNVGLSHDLISLSMEGTYLVSLVMVAGRALPLLILWSLATGAEKSPVAIG